MKIDPFELETELRLGDIPPSGVTVTGAFSEEACAALAERFGVVAVRSARFNALLKPFRKTGVSIDGELDAVLMQTCVVTLEDIEAVISEPFNVLLHPKADPMDIDSDIDPLPGDNIPLGEVIAEQIAVRIDLYPRKSGAEFEPIVAEIEKPNPFAKLAALKPGQKPEKPH